MIAMQPIVLVSLFGGSLAYNIYCDSQSYKAADNPTWPTTDAHCQASCNQFVGLPSGACLDSQCQCAGPGEKPSTNYCTSPRTCPFDKYEPNPGTTVAGSEWCNQNCNTPAGAPRNCPCTMCLCGNPCGEGEAAINMTFDEYEKYSSTAVSSYKGFNFKNMYALNPKATHFQSGYANALKSVPMVAYNGFARPITFSEHNKQPFKFVSASFTGAWQNEVGVTVIGRLAGKEVFKWSAKTCTECHVRPENTTPTPIFGAVDEVTIISTSGIEDPDYPRGSGAHLAIEDMLLCAPKDTEFKTKVSEEQKIARREDQPNATEDTFSEGPMTKQGL